MSVKLLTEHLLEFLSLKRGCTGSSESTLGKMLHCWKSQVAALFLLPGIYFGYPNNGIARTAKATAVITKPIHHAPTHLVSRGPNPRLEAENVIHIDDARSDMKTIQLRIGGSSQKTIDNLC